MIMMAWIALIASVVAVGSALAAALYARNARETNDILTRILLRLLRER